MARDWSAKEVDLAVDLYFEMLNLELDQVPFVKAEYERRLSGAIGRSRKAASFKFSNISAALYELGAAFIDGYKPLPNLQGILRERVTDHFEADAEIRRAMLRSVERPPESDVDLVGATSPPRVDIAWTALGGVHQGRHPNYLELEANNRALGLAGEIAALRWEQRRLAEAGRVDLAEKVEHVSVTEGDGLGFDIHSFRVTGADRFIEVKTTRYAAATPFYLSSNEVEVSQELGEQFTLLRIFKHGSTKPGHYELDGPLESTATLRAVSFKGLPKTTPMLQSEPA